MKKIVITIIIFVVFIGILAGLSLADVKQIDTKPTYQELMVNQWNHQPAVCGIVSSLEELQDYGDSIELDLEILATETKTYELSTEQMESITSNVNKVTECINEKTSLYASDDQ